MGLFNNKKMDVEEEIEFLYDNDMERIKKWKKAKMDSIFGNIFSWIMTIVFISYCIYQIIDIDISKNLQNDSMFFWLLIILVLVRNNENHELKFLSSIGVLKRKIQQNKENHRD